MSPGHHKRNRGAQPGNQNARKHGSPRLCTGAPIHKTLTSQQQSILPGAVAVHGLDREVAVLRVKIASILQNDPHNLDVLFHAVSALGRTLRTRQSLVHADRQESRDLYDSRGLYRRFVSWLKAENDLSVS
jgi:hypothetical protein